MKHNREQQINQSKNVKSNLQQYLTNDIKIC